MIKGMDDPNLLPDENTCWQAVLARDPAYNGIFFYGVRSTGVFCRPTCPSRRPRRAQAVFYPTWEAAESAGYRPCRRCLPRQSEDPPVDLVNRTRRLIESAGEPLKLAELGRQLGISPFHLQRTFKAVTGLTPRQYAAAFRARQLKEQLRSTPDVTTAQYVAGYNASSRLYESAPGYLGMTPAAYREGGKGMRITFTMTDCPHGRLLVAGTETGICTVLMGDTDADLMASLAAEFPEAECVQSNSAPLLQWATALREHLTGRRPRLDLPLDVLGTAFQHRVWAELRKIPYGETRSYAQVAQAIGRPQAVRAVARACATNPAALVIPCHRVVRSDGSLGGYRWGLTRKQALLKKEKE
ncbi:MAG: bifunctional DNA-binding transcriptional regulator/O6-methylguanine-DNA methyltransferase Ada [Chloroflexi bacterium]|nr:MAG: bifunctional DNA-binding transcriptional regulator/O6-methylguanine-DNA methyltransferase Ada [Chloroflexota bacterium]